MTGGTWPDGMSSRYRLFRRVVVTLGRFFLGLTIHGGENAPERGPLVVASNHRRFFDPVFVCLAVPRRIQWMAKKELFVPGLRRFFTFLGAFSVDRQGGGRAALRIALTFITDGSALGIFPEGTRRKDGASSEAKSGAVMLAVRGNARVLPVYIGRIPGPAARLRGEKFRVYVGEPVTMDQNLRGRQEYRDAADDLLHTIYALPERELEDRG
ncbi:MAG: 1-acyl-sn-glycerol-3-phosphate acyltransferase [Rubrobacter sp.]|nr:1-acyl-sn-glycerol-3-phosphate acyltransferase [Rubrobacter sp.]